MENKYFKTPHYRMLIKYADGTSWDVPAFSSFPIDKKVEKSNFNNYWGSQEEWDNIPDGTEIFPVPKDYKIDLESTKVEIMDFGATNDKIVNDDEATFRVVVKRSDLKKAEDLHNKGDIAKQLFDRKDDWAECYSMANKDEDGFTFIVWPTSWGYLGYKDGYNLHAVSMLALLNGALSVGEAITLMSTDNNVVVEIDENN